MAILNYTTSIDATKTIGEIQSILAQKGAKKIILDYDDQCLPVSLTFQIVTPNGVIGFLLPSNYQGVLRAMEKGKVPRAKCTKEQALRVSWRILKDWVEAQMALIEAEMVMLEQVFLPYAIAKNGQTVFELINSQKLLN